MDIQIFGEISTGSGSGYPGIDAIRTISLAGTCCKDGKERWASASRSYPQRQLDVIATPRAIGMTHFVWEALITKYSFTPAAVLQDEIG